MVTHTERWTLSLSYPILEHPHCAHSLSMPVSFFRELHVNCALVLRLCGVAPAETVGGDNLDFASGKLTAWEGNGFYLTTANGYGPTVRFGVCSRDNGTPG